MHIPGCTEKPHSSDLHGGPKCRKSEEWVDRFSGLSRHTLRIYNVARNRHQHYPNPANPMDICSPDMYIPSTPRPLTHWSSARKLVDQSTISVLLWIAPTDGPRAQSSTSSFTNTTVNGEGRLQSLCPPDQKRSRELPSMPPAHEPACSSS